MHSSQLNLWTILPGRVEVLAIVLHVLHIDEMTIKSDYIILFIPIPKCQIMGVWYFLGLIVLHLGYQPCGPE